MPYFTRKCHSQLFYSIKEHGYNVVLIIFNVHKVSATKITLNYLYS